MKHQCAKLSKANFKVQISQSNTDAGQSPDHHLVKCCREQAAHSGGIIHVAQCSRLALRIQGVGTVEGGQSAPTLTPTPTPTVLITHALRPIPGSTYCYFLHLQA